MIKSVDPFLDRVYVPGRYTCLHYAAEVWEAATGNKLHSDVMSFLEARTVGREARARYRRVDKPVSPCIVLFRGHKESHIGVFIRGKVIHLSERDGVQYVPVHVVAIWFPVVRYYVEHAADR